MGTMGGWRSSVSIFSIETPDQLVFSRQLGSGNLICWETCCRKSWWTSALIFGSPVIVRVWHWSMMVNSNLTIHLALDRNVPPLKKLIVLGLEIPAHKCQISICHVLAISYLHCCRFGSLEYPPSTSTKASALETKQDPISTVNRAGWWFQPIQNVESDQNPLYPLVIKHGNGKSPNWMEALIGKSLINGPCSIAMFDCRRVIGLENQITFQ